MITMQIGAVYAKEWNEKKKKKKLTDEKSEKSALGREAKLISRSGRTNPFSIFVHQGINDPQQQQLISSVLGKREEGGEHLQG